MLRNNKDEGWKEDGVKWKERQVRKRTYEAIKSSKPDPPKRQISPWIESIADGFFGDWDIYEGREVAFVFHQNGTESRVVHRPNHHRIRGGRSRATSRRTEPTAVIEIPDSDEIEPRPAGSP
ncbi:hypothetical protein FS842_007435 [Serendipita sp. 407]|nr:hypothetical protein FS842_007435 [Serendipita sp. 407]